MPIDFFFWMEDVVLPYDQIIMVSRYSEPIVIHDFVTISAATNKDY